MVSTPKTADGLPPGTVMGRYELIHRLAMGGMAELYVARQCGIHGFERTVAVKRVLPHLAQDPEFVRMLVDEARIAAVLDHPNIAQVTDIGDENGECFLAMEYVHGKNLREILREEPNGLPMEIALTIVAGVAAGLHHAHEALGPDGRRLGLVHRDVSPSNVMVGFSGAVKLTDFGIAKAYAVTSKTVAGGIKGKVGYMSPEQCRAEPLDRRSDIFALGILLYEATTGARAFHAPNPFAAMARIARVDYIAPRELDREYPEELERIIDRALQKLPDHRYDTVEQMLAAIAAHAESRGYTLSSVEVAHLMRERFGTPAHPQTLAIPKPTGSRAHKSSLITGPVLLAGAALAILATGALWAVERGPGARELRTDQPATGAELDATPSLPRPIAPVEPQVAAPREAEAEQQARAGAARERPTLDVDALPGTDADARSERGAPPAPAHGAKHKRRRARKRTAPERVPGLGPSPYPPGYKP